MTDRSTQHLQEAIKTVNQAPAQSTPEHSLAVSQAATAHALIAVAEELKAMRQAVEDLKEAVTDADGFSSADHLRNINGWVERIAKG
ncbi:hypothetical protein FBZ33_6534 [Micromonospora sp. A202]|uniref:hypothetical protein n=1 Tax=Micromonospora sp. A202 TaxID=2572899 RepID=UPI001153E97D|nr:hypothetical protein [Micromonospora sp. A202]TQJ26148.1 hypothetical protein FBZ33_6534 [Micromonospora sp. A202]